MIFTGAKLALIQVYTPAGRRMLPAMKLGAAPASLSSNGAWGLLVVCRDGSLRVWDVQHLTSLLDTNVAPLVSAAPAGTAGLGNPIPALLPLHSRHVTITHSLTRK